MQQPKSRRFGEVNALAPHGLALLAYFEGQAMAQLIVRRDDGIEVPVPVSHFFRPSTEFSPVEVAALEHCRGHVLDAGAGSGLHSLYLQSKGMTVTAIDVSSEAVEIMLRRGVQDVHVADVFRFQGGPFDTILMLGHGIGMVGDLLGLDRFLAHAREITADRGQVLLHSVDVRQTDDPNHLAYHEANRQAGRYAGEIRVQFEYDGQRGPYCRWLHVDLETLGRRAAAVGWECELILEQGGGDYLACLR
jgi:SAM-dependent methyltransferase